MFAFQDDANMFFVIDYAQGGDLRFHLDKLMQIEDLTLQYYAAELCSAITYMHSESVAHRYAS